LRLSCFDQFLKTRRATFGSGLNKLKTVADILEQERQPTINEWLRRVNLVTELTQVPLSDADRTRHLPRLFNDVISRLRLAKDSNPHISIAAAAHGKIRWAQGYSAAMLIEEIAGVSGLHIQYVTSPSERAR
jgi:hypothetical protein